MKNFTDELVNLIIANEASNVDKIMNEVTKKISVDFTTVMYGLIDKYYENYDPIRYVRVYGKRGKHAQNKKPKPGQVSLHAAVTRGGNDTISFSGGSYYDGYVGGIQFDESKFKGNGMRHIGKGISEWNIVENFLFAGSGVNSDMESLNGDIRSHIDYEHPSADLEMMRFMSTYSKVDKYYKDALGKVR